MALGTLVICQICFRDLPRTSILVYPGMTGLRVSLLFAFANMATEFYAKKGNWQEHQATGATVRAS